MKHSGGFAVVELLIALAVIAIIGVGGYYVIHRNHQKPASDSTTITKDTPIPAPAPPTKSNDPTKFNIPDMGIQLVSVPASIKDLIYTFYPANTAANYTQAQFSTVTLAAKADSCSIGILNKYPGKFNAATSQGPAEFVKQFKDFWIAEVDAGIPCSQKPAILNLENAQTTTFKQFVTKPDNLQLLP